MNKNKTKMTIFLAVMLALVACGGSGSSSSGDNGSTSKPSDTSQISSQDISSDDSGKQSSDSGNQSSGSGQQSSGSGQQSSDSGNQSSGSGQQSSDSSGDTSSSGGGGSGGGESGDDPVIDPELEPYILKHKEGQSANYVFEAEFADMRGKSGTGYSGGTSTYRDFAGSDDRGRGYITYLYREGISINFFVVCDRDVNNAKFSVMLGAEYMNVHLTPNNYAFRVDPDVLATDPDALKDYEKGGCLGNWDDFFLNWYTVEETGGYYIGQWECEEIDIGEDGCELGYWSLHTITLNLSLKKGFNCISMITDNNSIDGDEKHGTMAATAPCIDYISIETTAQLGVFDQQQLNVGDVKNAIHFA